MNILFQINTVYQLLTAINLKLHDVPEKGSTGIIVTDHTPLLREYVGFIKKCRLFDHVFYIGSQDFNKYFWSLDNEIKPEVFKDAENSLKQIICENIDLYRKYDVLVLSNLDAYTKFIYSLYPHLRIYIMEDGAGTYTTDWKTITKKWDYIDGFNKAYNDIKAIYLYDPSLMQFNVCHKLEIIPKLYNSDTVINLINNVFGYDTNFEIPRFVFCEEPFQVDNIKNNDLDLISLISDKVGSGQLMIKTHPRNTINRTAALGLGIQKETPWPFEVLLLNNKETDSTFITVTSGSLISPRMLMDISPKTIFLYRLIKGDTHNFGEKEFKCFLNSYVERYKGKNMMAPGSLYELNLLLDLLLRDDREGKCY